MKSMYTHDKVNRQCSLRHICTHICIIYVHTSDLTDTGTLSCTSPGWGQCWWGWKLPDHVSKTANIYTSCAMQLQLVSKFSWSKQIVKWLPTPMSPPHKSCSAFSSHWFSVSYHHGDPSSLSASSLGSFAISLGVPFPIDLREAYLSSSPLWVFGNFFFLRDRTWEGSCRVMHEQQKCQWTP